MYKHFSFLGGGKSLGMDYEAISWWPVPPKDQQASLRCGVVWYTVEGQCVKLLLFFSSSSYLLGNTLEIISCTFRVRMRGSLFFFNIKEAGYPWPFEAFDSLRDSKSLFLQGRWEKEKKVKASAYYICFTFAFHFTNFGGRLLDT